MQACGLLQSTAGNTGNNIVQKYLDENIFNIKYFDTDNETVDRTGRSFITIFVQKLTSNKRSD